MPEQSFVDIGGYRIEKLRGEANWPEWSKRIKGVMVLSGELWGWVDGTNVMPTKDLVVWSLDQASDEHVRRQASPYELHLATEAFRSGDSRAVATLMHAIDYETWIKVEWEIKRNLDSPKRSSESASAEAAAPDPTAREIWAALKRIYANDEYGELRRQMYHMKLGANEKPLELAYRMIKHTNRMKDCGVQVEDDMVAYLLREMLQDTKEAQWLRMVYVQKAGNPTTSDIVRSLEQSAHMEVVARREEEEERRANPVQAAGQDRQAGGRRQRERALAAGEQRSS